MARFLFQLHLHSGVPVYRQIMDQISAAVAAGRLAPGDQLPTVRQLAVDLAINPNTVIRAYRELEIRGILDTHQGSGTFVGAPPTEPDENRRQQILAQLATEFAVRAGASGIKVSELLNYMQETYGPKPEPNPQKDKEHLS